MVLLRINVILDQMLILPFLLNFIGMKIIDLMENLENAHVQDLVMEKELEKVMVIVKQ